MITQLLAVSQPVPAGPVVQWGWVTITVANLVVILAMILVFVLALLLPFRNRVRTRTYEPTVHAGPLCGIRASCPPRTGHLDRGPDPMGRGPGAQGPVAA